jgi:hypothetical protein
LLGLPNANRRVGLAGEMKCNLAQECDDLRRLQLGARPARLHRSAGVKAPGHLWRGLHARMRELSAAGVEPPMI